jgi:hypothetical protein
MKSVTVLVAISILLVSACAPDQPGGAVSDSAPETSAVAAATVEPAAPAGAFDQTLELQGITFRVTCPNASSINEATIVPAGLEIDNSPITREVDGSVIGAEVADLDANGSPEVYVYVTSAGSGSYGSLLAYAANNRKSLSEIYLPPLEEDPEASSGYMGHDEFTILELRLGRRFPIYSAGDTNAEPTGGTRQLQYRLEPGEAGWILRVDDRVDFD